jgi:hypothetical protein
MAWTPTVPTSGSRRPTTCTEKATGGSSDVTFSTHINSPKATITRCSLFLLLLAAWEPFVTKARYDWQDNHEMKHEQKIYADLEEGGDEGGDDD